MFDLQRDFFDHLSKGDAHKACEIFAEDGIFSFPGLPEIQGRRKIELIFKRIGARFTNIRWEMTNKLEGQNAKDRFFIAQWKVMGTFKTQKPYLNGGASILTLDQNNKVSYFQDYLTSTDLTD